LLLEYLLKNGSEKVISETRQRIFDIKTLTSFNYIDETDVDRGLSVRERSKQIVDLVQDTDRLRDERKNAAKTRMKYNESISSGDVGGYASQSNDKRQDPNYGRSNGGVASQESFDNPRPVTKKGFDYPSSSSDDDLPVKEEWRPNTKGAPVQDDIEDFSDFGGNSQSTYKPYQPQNQQPHHQQPQHQPQPVYQQPQPQHQQPQPQPQYQQPQPQQQPQNQFYNPLDALVGTSSLLGQTSATAQPEKSKVDLLGSLLATPSPQVKETPKNSTYTPGGFGTLDVSAFATPVSSYGTPTNNTTNYYNTQPNNNNFFYPMTK